MANRVIWFDLPVKDLNRAMQFYTAVLKAKVAEDQPGVAVIEHEPGEMSGCLYCKHDEEPSGQGALLYFNVDGRLDDAVSAVETNGGKVLQPPHAIGPWGHRAVVLDCEGNRIALHSS